MPLNNLYSNLFIHFQNISSIIKLDSKEKGENMSKKKEERQLQIRQILEEKEKLKVKELAKLLSVTPETLRKDLSELQERKILVREHGYAKIQSSSVETFVELKAQENREM